MGIDADPSTGKVLHVSGWASSVGIQPGDHVVMAGSDLLVPSKPHELAAKLSNHSASLPLLVRRANHAWPDAARSHEFTPQRPLPSKWNHKAGAAAVHSYHSGSSAGHTSTMAPAGGANMAHSMVAPRNPDKVKPATPPPYLLSFLFATKKIKEGLNYPFLSRINLRLISFDVPGTWSLGRR